jgi:hypothetical protein
MVFCTACCTHAFMHTQQSDDTASALLLLFCFWGLCSCLFVCLFVNLFFCFFVARYGLAAGGVVGGSRGGDADVNASETVYEMARRRGESSSVAGTVLTEEDRIFSKVEEMVDKQLKLSRGASTITVHPAIHSPTHPLTIRHPPSTIRHPPSLPTAIIITVHPATHSPTHHPPSAIFTNCHHYHSPPCCPLTHPPSAVHHPPSLPTAPV